jgi:hypothetical protein
MFDARSWMLDAFYIVIPACPPVAGEGGNPGIDFEKMYYNEVW